MIFIRYVFFTWFQKLGPSQRNQRTWWNHQQQLFLYFWKYLRTKCVVVQGQFKSKSSFHFLIIFVFKVAKILHFNSSSRERYLHCSWIHLACHAVHGRKYCLTNYRNWITCASGGGRLQTYHLQPKVPGVRQWFCRTEAFLFLESFENLSIEGRGSPCSTLHIQTECGVWDIICS